MHGQEGREDGGADLLGEVGMSSGGGRPWPWKGGPRPEHGQMEERGDEVGGSQEAVGRGRGRRRREEQRGGRAGALRASRGRGARACGGSSRALPWRRSMRGSDGVGGFMRVWVLCGGLGVGARVSTGWAG